MANDDTSSGAGATPTQPDPPVTGTPAPGSATPQKPTLTLEEALKRVADLEHSQANAKEELERHRRKLSTFEKAEKEAEAAKKAAEEAQLSEIERVSKQYAELQAQHAAYTQQAQERLVRYEVEREAQKLGIIDPDAAARLLDWSELEFDDNGSPTNATKLLEKLLKNKPYLAPAQPSQQQQTPAGSPTRPAAPALPAMQPGRTSILPPGSRPPGKIPRLSDPGVFVPPGTPSKYQP